MKSKYAFVFATALALVSFAACASQIEGDRCRSNEDCGLDSNNVQMSCVSTSALGGERNQVTVCCPAQGATHTYCTGSGTGGFTNPDAQGPDEEEPAAGDDAGSEPTDDAGSEPTDDAGGEPTDDAGNEPTDDAGETGDGGATEDGGTEDGDGGA